MLFGKKLNDSVVETNIVNNFKEWTKLGSRAGKNGHLRNNRDDSRIRKRWLRNAAGQPVSNLIGSVSRCSRVAVASHGIKTHFYKKMFVTVDSASTVPVTGSVARGLSFGRDRERERKSWLTSTTVYSLDGSKLMGLMKNVELSNVWIAKWFEISRGQEKNFELPRDIIYYYE